MLRLAARADAGGVGRSDVGAKTKPPWARAEESAAIQPSARAAGNGKEQSECVRKGRQRIHAQVAGDGAVTQSRKKRARRVETSTSGKQDESSRHTGGSADQIAAARDLAFLASFLTAPRSCLFGLVGLCHRSVASSQLPVVSSRLPVSTGRRIVKTRTGEFSPGGATELSPALQRWEKRKKWIKSRRDDRVLTHIL